MTLSIAARFLEANMFGVAIASSSPAVAARCAHARRGAGAVATQNITDPSLGPQILDGSSTELGLAKLWRRRCIRRRLGRIGSSLSLVERGRRWCIRGRRRWGLLGRLLG